MGVKVLLCFPFYKRCKGRWKNRHCAREIGTPVSSEEREDHQKTRLSSSTSVSSETGSSGNLEGQRAFFSQKARVSLRHQIDSNVNEVDATY